MAAYIIRRLLLVIPTLFGIMVINFFIIQTAPGGPVEQVLARLQGTAVEATARVSGGGGEQTTQSRPQSGPGGGAGEQPTGVYRGARGMPPELVAQIEKEFGFDKPMHERFFLMIGRYLRFDFGESYFRSIGVIDLVLEKMPVSISLGICKAVRDGSSFDVWTSGAIIVGNAVPSFLFAILLIVLFAGGSFWQWFPLRGLVSDGWSEMSLLGKIADYLWHMVLPVTAMVIGGFASLTMLTKNSFMEEIGKQYVVTARGKGMREKRVLYGHVFRNAMLIVIAAFPAAFVGVLFTGSLLIEVIFSLDGLGLLGFEAVINRDYPVVFGTLYMLSLLGLLLGIVGDLMYIVVDPRIDFSAQG